MTEPDVAQPDDEQPVTATPAEQDDTLPGERQAKPDQQLADDDLQAGQYEPGA